MGDIAAHAEPAIAQEIAAAVERRQARQFHLEPFVAAVDRPGNRDVAPGLVRRDGLGDAPGGIEAEFRVDFGPRPPRHDLHPGADDAGEFFRAEGEPAGGVHLPDETQGVTALRGPLRGSGAAWLAVAARRRPVGGCRRGGGRLGHRIGKPRQQHRAGAAADPLQDHGADPGIAAGTARRERRGGKRCRADGIEPRAPRQGGARPRRWRTASPRPGRRRRSPPFRESRAGAPAPPAAAPLRPVRSRSRRIPGVRPRSKRAQEQVSELHAAPAKPRRRNSRAPPPSGRVSAIRSIWARAGSPMANARSRSACEVFAPSAAQPAGLAHRMRAPSALHSHTAIALVACAASRASPR